MPLEGCPHCDQKWAVEDGGVCPICRTLDRLAVVVRGPDFPATAGKAVLGKLRGWVAEAQDLSEGVRGVVPDPLGFSAGTPGKAKPKDKGSKSRKAPEEEKAPKKRSPTPQKSPKSPRVLVLPGAKSCGKASPPSPPDRVKPGSAADKVAPEDIKEEEPSEEARPAKAADRGKKKRKARSSSSRSERRRRKRSRKSRSPGRSPISEGSQEPSSALSSAGRSGWGRPGQDREREAAKRSTSGAVPSSPKT